MLTQRPVRSAYTRAEEMQVSSPRGAERIYIKDGVMHDGRIVARYVRVYCDAGAYSRLTPYGAVKAAAHMPGPYYIPNVWVDSRCVYTNRTPSSAMRGFGVTGADFALEIQMDKLARLVGADPMEFRIQNAYRDGDMKAHRRVTKERRAHRVRPGRSPPRRLADRGALPGHVLDARRRRRSRPDSGHSAARGARAAGTGRRARSGADSVGDDAVSRARDPERPDPAAAHPARRSRAPHVEPAGNEEALGSCLMSVISSLLVSTDLQPVENPVICYADAAGIGATVCEAGHRCRAFPALTTSHDLREHDGGARTDGPPGHDRRAEVLAAMTKRRGRGVASVNYPIGMNLGGDPSQALVHANPGGKFTVSLSSIDLGQGMKSVVRQICAEALGVPVEDVFVDTADSDTGPHCMGSFASRGTHRVGNAVIAAAQEARGVLLEAAADKLEVDASDLVTDGGATSMCVAPPRVQFRWRTPRWPPSSSRDAPSRGAASSSCPSRR